MSGTAISEAVTPSKSGCKSSACPLRPHRPITWSIPMMDVVMLALAFVFFAVSIAYVYACERL
jgi:hypothetical protein